MGTRRLVRSRDNRMVSGVIGGLCEYFGLSADLVTIFRILYVILAFSSFGGLILLYFAAAIIIPAQPARNPYEEKQRYQDSGAFTGAFRNESGNSYEDKWNAKAGRNQTDTGNFEEKVDRWADDFEKKAEKWAEKFSQKADKFGDKMDKKFDSKYNEKYGKSYEDKWSSGNWDKHSASWNDPWEQPNSSRKIKEAEPVDETDDDWSDF